MTYSFGNTSTKRLNGCHPDIIKIMRRAIELSKYDFSIICGKRGEEEQEKAFADGKSKARYGESPHNCEPVSLAVDVVPYVEHTLMWDDKELFAEIAGAIHAAQDELYNSGAITHQIENGGEKWGWDYPHWQIVGWKGLK